MTMAMNNQQNEPPHGELMRITCKGLSWAENICQRVEKICTENNMVKNSYKYIDAVGEYLKKKILDAVVNDFDNLEDDDPVFFSNASLGPDTLYNSSEKEGTKFAGIASDGKLSPCGNGELATSSVENLSLKQDNGINITKKSATIPRLACNKVEKTDDCSVLEDGTVTKISTFDYVEDLQANLPNKSVLLIEEDASTGKFKTAHDGELNCSVSRETSYEGFLHGTVFAADWNDSVPLSSQSLSSISHHCIFIGERSSCQSVGVDSKPQETLCILESGESEDELKKGPERTGTCVISPKCECQENSCSREEDYRNYSVFSMENDDIDEFEDATVDNQFKEVKVEDCWDDILNYKIGENSSQMDKRLSYKEKLKRMLHSRFWSSRDSELVKYHGDLHSLASLDSDWELI